MDMQSDSELVQIALNGDRQAYGRLFERHERSVWVRKIARHEAITVRRRLRKAQSPGPAAPEQSELSCDGTIDEQTRLLLDAVMQLPKHEQEVLTLHCFEGHPVKTISEMTGRPVGTVTMQLSRARLRLRKELKENLP